MHAHPTMPSRQAGCWRGTARRRRRSSAGGAAGARRRPPWWQPWPSALPRRPPSAARRLRWASMTSVGKVRPSVPSSKPSAAVMFSVAQLMLHHRPRKVQPCLCTFTDAAQQADGCNAFDACIVPELRPAALMGSRVSVVVAWVFTATNPRRMSARIGGFIVDHRGCCLGFLQSAAVYRAVSYAPVQSLHGRGRRWMLNPVAASYIQTASQRPCLCALTVSDRKRPLMPAVRTHETNHEIS